MGCILVCSWDSCSCGGWWVQDGRVNDRREGRRSGCNILGDGRRDL